MKTETEIAKENIRRIQDEFDNEMTARCQEHKQACQRWLDFLERIIKYIEILKPIQDSIAYEQIHNKTQDLKTAIKLYEENGI